MRRMYHRNQRNHAIPARRLNGGGVKGRDEAHGFVVGAIRSQRLKVNNKVRTLGLKVCAPGLGFGGGLLVGGYIQYLDIRLLIGGIAALILSGVLFLRIDHKKDGDKT
jgi:hypothetical protein